MSKPRVALFVTCLIENMRPSLGFDVIDLIEAAGFSVEVPERQVCCGQPNYNGGDHKNAIKTARQVIKTFAPYDYVVIASGSCGGMLKHHYPELLAREPESKAAEALAAKVYELSQFLTEVAGMSLPNSTAEAVAYHDACAGLRELGIRQAPRELLQQSGVEIVELADSESCCGFGGTFCVKYPDISNAMVGRKVEDILATGQHTVVMGDLGCMLNIEGKLHREGHAVRVRHYAELLAENLRRSQSGAGE